MTTILLIVIITILLVGFCVVLWKLAKLETLINSLGDQIGQYVDAMEKEKE